MSTAPILDLPAEKVEHVHRTIANVRGRLGLRPVNYVNALSAPPWKRRLARAALLVPRVRHFERYYDSVSDDELRKASMVLRGKARGGWNLDRLIPEAFGLGAVAIYRILGFRPFDVQIAAGVVMHYGGLVELATGEGKTVTASLPTYLNALPGKGTHVTTVNDYLAKRDAEWIGPVYRKLGLTLGCLQQKMDDRARVEAYQCDITYSTASEIGFDFLRDRLKLRGGQTEAVPFWSAWTANDAGVRRDPRVQRDLYYAIVDEADSIFIDEAKTPLIIANPTQMATEAEQVVYKWADKLSRKMKRDVHFTFDLKKDKTELTDEGRHMMRYADPPRGAHTEAMDKLQEAVEKGLQAHHRFVKDQHYMISSEGKIVIIDESTGRPMPDRHWRDGLHQAVEAKEKVQINAASGHAAQITYQSLFRLYKKLGGMSGTLMPNFWELRKVYKRWTSKVPTNQPGKRINMLDAVYPTEDAKFDGVVVATREMVRQGRPVLIGTRTVEASEKLSQKLTAGGVQHLVLNARQDKSEAEVVASAGQMCRVTVATNMAGRGTDIKLGPGVAEAGGLHVIGTERHDAERIDRQLAGRAGRQGDPGSAQFFLSLEDQLLEGLGHRRRKELKRIGEEGGNRDWNAYRPLFRKAQRKVERKHYRQRLDLMHYDKQRQEMLQDLGADAYVD